MAVYSCDDNLFFESKLRLIPQTSFFVAGFTLHSNALFAFVAISAVVVLATSF